MIFYSREIGRDGEKDYIDTDDFKDVYFEKEEFTYIKNGSEFRSNIDFELAFEPVSKRVDFVGRLKDGNYTICESVTINPVDVVEQGAVAYYNEELLDNIEIIKRAKTDILNKLQTRLIEDDCLLKGTNLDILGLVYNNGNTIATLDNITIIDNETIRASKFYSVVNIETIMAGTITMLLSDEKVLTGDINSIRVSGNEIIIKLNNMNTKLNTTDIKYTKSNSFKDMEEYHEDRAQYISVDSCPEADFDEFDDLF